MRDNSIGMRIKDFFKWEPVNEDIDAKIKLYLIALTRVFWEESSTIFDEKIQNNFLVALRKISWYEKILEIENSSRRVELKVNILLAMVTIVLLICILK